MEKLRKKTDDSSATNLPLAACRLPRRSGFTLIEMLIVIAISAMLSAIAVGYSSESRNEIALSVQATTISQLILQAKSLAVATYGDASGACGFGVSFDVAAQTYSIFTFTPAGAPPCPSDSTLTGLAGATIGQYTQGTWQVHVSSGVVLSSGSHGDGLADVLFYPPNPDTLVSRDGSTFMSSPETSYVYLATVDGGATETISVSPGGQVDF